VSAVPALPPTAVVPELAPSLGRLVVPRRVAELWAPLDDVREGLASDVIRHAGEARGAARESGMASVVSVLGSDRWRAAWERAVRRAAGRMAGALDAEIERVAWQVRMPRRHWRRRLLTAAERRAVAVRLALGGESLAPALAALDVAARALTDAGVADPDRLRDWHDALRLTARRLEAAWLALEAATLDERQRWAPEIAAIGDWRPRLWPVIVAWVPLAAALLWLGFVLGGYLPAPAWLATRLGF